MNTQKPAYTFGIWIIKSGHEKDFIHEWTTFADWMNKNTPGLGKGFLLQDEKNPLRFISLGSWESENVIQNWRESKEFKEFVGKVMPWCDDFQPNTLNEIYRSEL